MAIEKKDKNRSTSCETCSNYIYDEDWEEYTCMVNLDEDEYARFLSAANFSCPYYRLDDEYKLASRQ